jgi:DUF1365 family protein
MTSCLYPCHVMHQRFTPAAHRFLYRIFLFAIDLDELDELGRRLPFFSVDRANLFSFRQSDYLRLDGPVHNAPTDAAAPAASLPLKQRVELFLRSRGVELAGGRVTLVTLPRILGHIFNPVSFYFCTDRHGAPLAAIVEVTNTFRESKPYLLGPDRLVAPAGPGAAAAFRHREPKFFYVSPFSDVDVAFDFHLRIPGPALAIQIDDYAGAERTLTSTLTGRREALTTARLAWYALKFPLLSVRVVTLIHWHALLLWLKKVPWFAKAARPADQRNVHQPHASLRPAAPRPSS